MDPRAPWLELRRAAALGCIAAFALILDPATLSALGAEAWGGVLFLSAIGASTAAWRVRSIATATNRSPGFALSAALGITLGALARTAPVTPLVILGAIGVTAWHGSAGRGARLAHVALFVVAVVTGFGGESWSAGGRLVQASVGFGLGASVALLVALGAPIRWRAAFAGAAVGGLAGGWASL